MPHVVSDRALAILFGRPVCKYLFPSCGSPHCKSSSLYWGSQFFMILDKICPVHKVIYAVLEDILGNGGRIDTEDFSNARP